ncbi:MAG: RsmD family RNA methyltransferase [bacterium]|jgi:16S rRNA (guanine966-N2)-methyltransferase
MRIIAGEWRGRRFEAPPTMDVRPTADRVRESWMSILQMEIPDARVLDLCSGSGALGLECLSRGAAFVDFIENDVRTLRVLQTNIAGLGAGERCAAHKGDAERFVAELDPLAYDLALADPPYKTDIAKNLVDRWLFAPFSAIFGVETARYVTLPEGGDRRTYGSTAITIYRA